MLSEVVLEGRLTAEQFRASIAAIVVQSALPQVYAAEPMAVTISAYSQTVASSIALAKTEALGRIRREATWGSADFRLAAGNYGGGVSCQSRERSSRWRAARGSPASLRKHTLVLLDASLRTALASSAQLTRRRSA